MGFEKNKLYMIYNYVMMHKIVIELIITSAVIGGIWRIKCEDLIGITGGVLVKNSPKIKSVTEESPMTLKVWDLGNCTYLEEEEAWCLYSGISLTEILWT